MSNNHISIKSLPPFLTQTQVCVLQCRVRMVEPVAEMSTVLYAPVLLCTPAQRVKPWVISRDRYKNKKWEVFFIIGSPLANQESRKPQYLSLALDCLEHV